MKIILNMIVKNEEKNILRCLTSALPLIDCLCIVDTGSTDKTKLIIKKFMKDYKVKGSIYDIEFENFEKSRNYALACAIADYTKNDFCFWMDADEQLILENTFDKKLFKLELEMFDGANSTVQYGSIVYQRNNFFRNDIIVDFKWKGAVHEVLMSELPLNLLNIGNIKTLVEVLPNYDKNKYLLHAKILAVEVDKHNSPRDVFYLAQSYKDAGETEHAIFYYKKRLLMMGFFEEKYYSQFMIALLYDQQNRSFKTTFSEYMKCLELDNKRAEPILNSIFLLQNNNMFQLAYILGKFAVEKFHLNPPKDRVLFIHEPTYSYLLLDAHLETCKILNVNCLVEVLNELTEHE